jgi:hypothetical protein
MVEGHPAQISAEGKIGISLTLLGLLGAGAIAVAPDQVWIIAWTLIAIAVIGLVLLFLYHVATYRRQRGQEAASMMPSMTPADIGYNVAIAAAIIAWLAAFWRRRTVAIIAAVIACGAVGFDFWYGPPRGVIFIDKGTWQWMPIAIGYDIGRYSRFGILGTNLSNKEVDLDDAYFVSGITGARVHLKVQVTDKVVAIDEINPVPPKAVVGLYMELSPPKGLTTEDFLKQWGPFSFVVTYGGKTQRIDFTREQTVQLVTPKKSEPWPYITLRHPTKN